MRETCQMNGHLISIRFVFVVILVTGIFEKKCLSNKGRRENSSFKLEETIVKAMRLTEDFCQHRDLVVLKP